MFECIKRLFRKKVDRSDYRPQLNYDGWQHNEVVVVALINRYRLDKGLNRFQPELLLHDLATNRARKLTEQSHNGVGTYFSDMTYNNFTRLREILGFGYTKPESVVEAWKLSEGHNRALLADVRYIGVGQYNNKWVAFICD